MTAVPRAILHQFWTDTRGLALYLAAWGVVLIAQAVLVLMGPTAWPQVRSGAPYSPDLMAMVMRVIVTVLLTVLVVHRDAAVGTTAFWRTRPIGSATMWASKAAWVAIWLMGAPALVAAALMAWLGLSPADAAYAGLITAIEQSLFIGIALMAAAVTDTMAHFIVAGFAGIAVYAAVLTVVQRPLRSVLPTFEAGGFWGPQVIGTLLMAAGGLAVLALAYVSRRVIAVAAVVLVLMASSIALSATRWTWPEPAPTPALRTLSDPNRYQLSVAPDSIRVNSEDVNPYTGHASQMRVSGSLTVSGGTPEMMFTVLSVRSTLRLPGGAGMPWQTSKPVSYRSGERATADSQPFRSMRIAIGNPEMAVPFAAYAREPAIDLTRLPQETFQRVASAEARLDADVRLRAYRQTAAVRLPLISRDVVRVGQASLAVASVERHSEGVVVELRGATIFGPWRSLSDWGTFVALHNPAKRQAIIRIQMRTSSTRLHYGFLMEHAGAEVRRMEFNPGADLLTRWGLDEQWLAGAELVFFGTEEIGTVTRPLTIAGLKLR